MSSSLVVSSKSHRRRSTSPSRPPKEQLSHALAAFESELLKNKNDGAGLAVRFKNLRGTGKLPDLTAIVRFTEEMSNDCATRHGGWRQYAMRVTPFLDRIRQFASIADVLVGGAQSMMASGAWAAVRLAIETSLSFLSFFDKVSDMLFRASKSFLLHREFSSLFPQSDQLQDLACEYLATTVRMCTQIVHFAQKSGWSQITSSLTSSFDFIFVPLENQLKETGTHIQLCTDALAIKADQQSHALTQRLVSSLQTSISQEGRLRALQARKHRLLTSLCPNQGDFDAIYRQLRRKGHSRCLLNEIQYKHWVRPRSSSSDLKLLWVRGKMGSGKSIIMASTVADLLLNERMLTHPRTLIRRNAFNVLTSSPTYEPTPPPHPDVAITVCYFFCTASIPMTLKADTILGSIAYQALSGESVSKSLTDYMQASGNLHMDVNPGTSVDLLTDILPENWLGRIVIDGLDECSSSDIIKVFEQLQRLSRSRTLSILGSCRTFWKDFDGATALFEDSPWSTIDVDDIDRSSEVGGYIADRMRMWKSAYSLSSESEDLIRQQLLIGWAGMFLWLALQCDVISEDLSEGTPVRNIISSLPRDLPEAYHRAILRIKDKSFASNIFKLVAVANPALTVDELRVAANVTPGVATWNPLYTTAHESAFLHMHAGHLLEMDENRKVYFIHHSVMMHLLDRPRSWQAQDVHFDPWLAEKHLGYVLITYLNLPHFSKSVTVRQQATSADHSQVPGKVIQSVVTSDSWTQRVLQHLRPRQQANAVAPMDITSVLSRLRQVELDPFPEREKWLLDYARANWVEATKRLDPLDITIRPMWEALMQGNAGIMSTSFLTQNPVSWAISHQHHCILQYFLSRKRGGDANSIVRVLRALVRTGLYHQMGPSLLPLAVQLLEDDSVDDQILDFLASTFATFSTHDSYGDDMMCRLRLVAPLVLQVLIMYTRSDRVACAMLPAVSHLLDIHAPLYKGESPMQLVYEFGKSAAFKDRLLGSTNTAPITQASDMHDTDTPLIRACRASNIACIHFLLDYGADIESRGVNGRTILMLAAGEGNVEIITRLLRLGADVAARDHTGQTALHHASARSSSDSLEALLQSGFVAGVTIDIQDSAGVTALHRACLALCADSVRLLVDAGAQLDLSNMDGNTPLNLLPPMDGQLAMDLPSNHARPSNPGPTQREVRTIRDIFNDAQPRT